jgi:hypothetical protein
MNFLGLISFLEKVPNPLISTLLSKATASMIDSKMPSIASDMFSLLKSENSFFKTILYLIG